MSAEKQHNYALHSFFLAMFFATCHQSPWSGLQHFNLVTGGWMKASIILQPVALGCIGLGMLFAIHNGSKGKTYIFNTAFALASFIFSAAYLIIYIVEVDNTWTWNYTFGWVSLLHCGFACYH